MIVQLHKLMPTHLEGELRGDSVSERMCVSKVITYFSKRCEPLTFESNQLVTHQKKKKKNQAPSSYIKSLTIKLEIKANTKNTTHPCSAAANTTQIQQIRLKNIQTFIYII